MKQYLFWATFIPLGLILIILGLLGWPYQIYRGCLFVYMELLGRFETWCFDGPRKYTNLTLKESFMEGFES